MNAWTTAAKDELNRFLLSIRQPLEKAGADAAEVIEDIKRHIDEEIAASRLRVVTVTELQPMLARIGEPWRRDTDVGDKASAAIMLQALKTNGQTDNSFGRSPGGAAIAEPPHEENPMPEPRETEFAMKAQQLRLPKGPFGPKSRPGASQLICGVLLPLATLLIEWITGFCATNIFNPLPTWGHVALVALVPIGNGIAWYAMRRDRDLKHQGYLAFAVGCALGVSIVYGVVFLPLSIPGIIALIIGIGLLPLTPYFALGASISLRTILKERVEAAAFREGKTPKLRFYPGILAALAAFVVLDISHLGTTSLMRMASTPATEESALRLLHWVGSEDTVLRACYANGRRTPARLFWFLDSPRVDVEQARRIYFQLYGRAFNSVPAPGPRVASLSAFDMRDDWDPERGGEKVGAPVPHLSLASSRIDATVDPNAALSYLEWIVEFNNAGFNAAEARCEIELPPGATVSRLTLWINGEEREAAFAGKSQVREAYQNVVVVQRRDPVLVTTSGKDRILMQCFPVQPNARMKVRLGMTVPLLLDSEKNGVLRWPYIRERNFELGEKLEHTFWIDSPMPVETLSIPLKTERTASGHYMARGTLKERDGDTVQPAVLIRRNPAIDRAWARDTRANDGSFVVQTIREKEMPALKDIVLVLDGSISMREVAKELGTAPLPWPRPLRGVVAGAELQEFTATDSESLARELRKISFSGGQNNIPALERAWDIAAENGAGAILWIHGPQPVEIGSNEGLKQRFERRQRAVRLFDLPNDRAANVVTKNLPAWAPVELVSMHRAPEQALAALMNELVGTATRYETVREKAQSAAGAESNLHLARLWASDEIARLARSGDRERAVELGGLYQLVTEVSGAVVLETAEQYKQAGLEPVSPLSVPSVPEPSTWALILIGLTVVVCYKRRKSGRGTEPQTIC